MESPEATTLSRSCTSRHAPPEVTSLVAAPGTVIRPDPIALTAHGVTDDDGEVVAVEFYHDTNRNGIWDPSADLRLSLDHRAGDGWESTVDTTGWELGEHTVFVSALDNDGVWSEIVRATVVITLAVDPTRHPTNYEQYLLELINRGRLDPLAEAARYGIDLNDGLAAGTISSEAKQPLTLSPDLIAAARGHSEWMLTTNTFSHVGDGGSSAKDRMAAAGYLFVTPWSCAENIAWNGTSGDFSLTQFTADIHANLFSSPGHRANQMNNSLREAGLGVGVGTFAPSGTPWNALIATEDFAYSGSTVFLTGVVYDDALVRSDDFYTPGEGLEGVNIRAVRNSDGSVFSTESWASGGYSLPLPSGTYTIAATGGLLTSPITRDQVLVSTQNVKVDFSVVHNEVPIVAALTTYPNPIIWPSSCSLVAEGVSDSDGTVLRVEFYHDDVLLGIDDEGTDGWTFTAETAKWELGEHVIHARAQDNQGAWSEMASVSVTVRHGSSPFAVLSVMDIESAGATTHTFSITFTDDFAVNVLTLGNWNLRVRGPGLFQQHATFVSVDVPTNGTPRRATYEITAPDEIWDAADSGIYEVWMTPLQVGDLDQNYARFGRLGTFAVTIDPSKVGVVPSVPAAEVSDDRFDMIGGQLQLRRGRTLTDSGEPTVTVIITVPDTSSPKGENPLEVPVSVQVTLWQNPIQRLDVNDDSFVSPLDALLIINQLNSGSEGVTRLVPSDVEIFQPFHDVNGDHQLSPFDALLVINFLNSGEGEGEHSADIAVPAAAQRQVADTTVQEPVGTNLSAEKQSRESKAVDSRQSASVLQTLDLLFAKLDDSQRTRTGESAATRKDNHSGDLEEFLDGMLSGGADEEEVLAAAAR